MRSLATIVAAMGIAIMPQTAHAEGLGGLLRSVTGVGFQAARNCDYYTGLNSVLCQAERASNIIGSVDGVRREVASQRQQEMNAARRDLNNRDRVAQALDAACRAGDAESCSRASRATNNSKIASALMEACAAGDDQSCDRIRKQR